MLRLTELALFLTPFALFAGWWFLGTRARWLLWAALGVLALLGTAMFWIGASQRLALHEVYVPARLQNGRIIEGHGL